MSKSVDKGQAGLDLDFGPLFNPDGMTREEAAMPIGFGEGTSRQMPDEDQLNSLFQITDKAGADVHAGNDQLARTLEEAVQELVAKKQQRSASRVVTCVYCDKRCMQKANQYGFSTPQSYYAEVIAEMNKIVQDGLDPGMTLELSFVLLPYAITEMSWFFDYSAKTSQELLTKINRKFWADSGLYDMAAANGCDLDFLTVAPEDPAWGYMGSIEGIANMFQLCSASYSTVLMKRDPKAMAKLMTHEFGHMIGIYHDGKMDNAFSSQATQFAAGGGLAQCAGEFSTLAGACTSTSAGCTGSCIMAATVDGTEWSECSKAYYGMFQCMTIVMPNYYNDKCTKN